MEGRGEIARYFYRISAVLLAAGTVCLVLGGRGMLLFLDDIAGYRLMTVRRFAVAVLLPHVLLLVGLCFLVFGIVMLVKGILFGREHSE